MDIAFQSIAQNGHVFFMLFYALSICTELASSWLACFPFLAKKHLYDIFFVDGPAIEVVQNLVPYLQPNAIDGVDVKAVCSNTERCEMVTDFFAILVKVAVI